MAVEREYLANPELIALVENLFDVRCAAGDVAGGFTKTTSRSESRERGITANRIYNVIPASRNFNHGSIIVNTLGFKAASTTFTVTYTYADGGTIAHKVVAIGSQTPLSALSIASKFGDGIVNDKACAKA